MHEIFLARNVARQRIGGRNQTVIIGRGRTAIDDKEQGPPRNCRIARFLHQIFFLAVMFLLRVNETLDLQR